jgi:hypothetical protein
MAAWSGGRRHLRPPSAHRALSGYLALALLGCASPNAESGGAGRATTPSAAAPPSTEGAQGETEKTPRRGLGIAVDPELELPAAAT